MKPAHLRIDVTQYDTLGWYFTFSGSVAGVSFEFVHSSFGTVTATGSGNTVTFYPTEPQAALAPGSYTYYLVASPGVIGSEQTVARGPYVVRSRGF